MYTLFFLQKMVFIAYKLKICGNDSFLQYQKCLTLIEIKLINSENDLESRSLSKVEFLTI